MTYEERLQAILADLEDLLVEVFEANEFSDATGPAERITQSVVDDLAKVLVIHYIRKADGTEDDVDEDDDTEAFSDDE